MVHIFLHRKVIAIIPNCVMYWIQKKISSLLIAVSISVNWRNRACCVKENFESFWCSV